MRFDRSFQLSPSVLIVKHPTEPEQTAQSRVSVVHCPGRPRCTSVRPHTSPTTTTLHACTTRTTRTRNLQRLPRLSRLAPDACARRAPATTKTHPHTRTRKHSRPAQPSSTQRPAKLSPLPTPSSLRALVLRPLSLYHLLISLALYYSSVTIHLDTRTQHYDLRHLHHQHQPRLRAPQHGS